MNGEHTKVLFCFIFCKIFNLKKLYKIYEIEQRLRNLKKIIIKSLKSFILSFLITLNRNLSHKNNISKKYQKVFKQLQKKLFKSFQQLA
jgi:hypothetical protein